jgi:NitT/TauT family transport system permease protein
MKSSSAIDRLLPFAGLVLVAAWAIAARSSASRILPGPWAVVLAIGELARRGLLLRYLIASLFRVTWGYLGAVITAVPFGLWLGFHPRADRALGPILQVLRPISPIAWIPIAILWFGVGDPPAVFIIFLGSFFPLALSAAQAVRKIPRVHIDVASNFGLSPRELVRKVILPAALPDLLIGLRLSLGVAWLVVVAAEMIAVNSGFGFLIVDARNAGDRYDLVVAGIVLIGATGVLLDAAMVRLSRLPSLRWAHASRGRR